MVEIGLVERNLRGVFRECFLKPVALDRFPVLGVDRLMFPEKRIVEIGAFQRVWSGNDDPVGVAAQAPVHSGKCQCLGRRKLKSGGVQMLARDIFEIMTALEDVPHTRR